MMDKRLLKDELEDIARRGIPEDTNLWPEIQAQLERSPAMRFALPRPLVAILLVGLSLLVLSGAVYAMGLTLGYIPGAGLVENSSGIRMLAEPVAVTRDGVTLTVSSLIAYEDRVEMVYGVEGVAPEPDASQSGEAASSPLDFCGGVEAGSPAGTAGDARLRLPDGTVLERDYTGKYAQNAFAMKPVYAASLPAEVTRVTFLLDCIPQARLGAAPESWEVPLELVTVPAGTVVGAPVVEVQATAAPSAPESAALPAEPASDTPEPAALPAAPASNLPDPVVTMTLSKIVPLDTRTIFYFSLDMEEKDPSLISIMPASVYVIDSQGQKIQLVGGFAWQPFEHRVGSEFEYASQTKPAEGPLTLVVENAVAYYAPLYSEPRQATPEEMSFTFDAGADPRYGQTWDLDESFEIAGYPVRVTSARAASFEDLETESFVDGSQGYDYGYDFAIESDPAVKMQVEMDIQAENANCWLSNQNSFLPDSSSIHHIQLCRDGYPSGEVRVTVRELSVLVENIWQAVWQP